LIDYPHDSADHARRFGLNLGNVESLLVTHGHSDHFYPCEFFLRGGCYAHKLKYPEFNIYGSAPVKRIFDSVAEAYNANAGILDTIKVNEFSAYETKRVGRYTVTALPAKHATHLSPLNYIIECDGKTLIYFHDTGFPNLEVLDFIKGKEKWRRVDCVMMDATMGVADIPETSGHMSFAQDKRLVELLKKLDIADDHTRFIANHITHNNAETHEKIEEIFEGTPVEVSYDGKVIEL
jgi:phosphoribosyl 1,2-cyclic phosphate phosphodiesterase